MHKKHPRSFFRGCMVFYWMKGQTFIFNSCPEAWCPLDPLLLSLAGRHRGGLGGGRALRAGNVPLAWLGSLGSWSWETPVSPRLLFQETALACLRCFPPSFLWPSGSPFGLRVFLSTSVLDLPPTWAFSSTMAVSEPPGLCPHFLAQRVTLGHEIKELI